MSEISEFYYKKPNIVFSYYIIFIILAIVLSIISIKYNTYDKKEILVINECLDGKCLLKTTLNYEELKILEKKPKIEYTGKTYKIEEIIYGEPYLSNGIPVTDVTIKTDIKAENKILNIEVKYNEQKIIKKLKQIFIERK